MAGAGSTPRWSGLFEGELPVAAAGETVGLEAIPARRGVFLLEDAAGRPILLATAADIRSRVRFRLSPERPDRPSRRADLREVAARVRWRLSYSHFQTDWHFLELARAVYPDTYPALLSYQPPWFVHLDLAEAVPAFRRTRKVLSGPGRYLGPFPDKHAAQRFVEVIQDVFELCRCETRLRRAPRAAPCVYAQMGRCRAPCAGQITLQEYRRQLAEAWRCAEGDRSEARERLTRQMREFAARREYERAGLCKLRLDRLAELERDEFRYVAPAERFQYLLVQRGPRPRQACVFLADRGFIRQAADLAYPLPRGRLERLLAGLRAGAARPRRVQQVQRYRMGLLCEYLFGSADRRGLIVRVDDALDASALAARIEEVAGALRLRSTRRGTGDRETAEKPNGC